MNSKSPLVSIGIPTFNRASMLRRSLDSALLQDYPSIQVIVSDNASTDETQAVCEEYCLADKRVVYVRHLENIGPAGNFMEVLKQATGEYFMWLGDDDWVDSSYVSHCILSLISDQDVSLVSGVPKYYKNGTFSFNGKIFDLLSNNWVVRVLCYYAYVADNGMFYGLMRTSELQSIKLKNTLAGDWNLVAKLVIFGKTKMISTTSVHRELGGASASYSRIVRSAGLPIFYSVFPMLTIGYGAYKDFAMSEIDGEEHNKYLKHVLGALVFFVVLIKPVISIPWRIRLRFQKVRS